MALSLEDLWKSAPDEEVVAAVGRWSSTNHEAQLALIAEIKRRGLRLDVPEVSAAPPKTSSTEASASTGKFLAVLAIVAVVGVALMVFVQ